MRSYSLFALFVLTVLVPGAFLAHAGYEALGRERDGLLVQEMMEADRTTRRILTDAAAEIARLREAEHRRDYYEYHSIYANPKVLPGNTIQLAKSPLARPPENPFVRGYFEIGANGKVTTPYDVLDLDLAAPDPMVADVVQELQAELQAVEPEARKAQQEFLASCVYVAPSLPRPDPPKPAAPLQEQATARLLADARQADNNEGQWATYRRGDQVERVNLQETAAPQQAWGGQDLPNSPAPNPPEAPRSDGTENGLALRQQKQSFWNGGNQSRFETLDANVASINRNPGNLASYTKNLVTNNMQRGLSEGGKIDGESAPREEAVSQKPQTIEGGNAGQNPQQKTRDPAAAKPAGDPVKKEIDAAPAPAPAAPSPAKPSAPPPPPNAPQDSSSQTQDLPVPAYYVARGNKGKVPTAEVTHRPFAHHIVAPAGKTGGTAPRLFACRQVEVGPESLVQGYEIDLDYVRNQFLPDLIQKYVAGKNLTAEVRPAKKGEAILLEATFPAPLAFLRLTVAQLDPAAIDRTVAGKRKAYLGMVSLGGLVATSGLFLVFRMLRGERELARKKGDFVAAVSHELKTPLTSIRMYAELLKEGLVTDPDKVKEYYEVMTGESERLSRLINNVLDFSRIERGTKTFNRVMGNVGEAVRDTVELLSNYLRARGFAVRVHLDEGLPEIPFDRDAISQIVINLVDNAAKYSHQADLKEIAVAVRRAPGGIAIEVEDHGIGIPRREQRRIFERFYRVPNETNREVQGVGLGLTLVQEFARAHGGSVELESDEGRGSRFRVMLGGR